MDEARAEAAKLIEAFPTFGDNARAEFEVWHMPEEMVLEYFELLRQAGVDIPDEDPETD